MAKYFISPIGTFRHPWFNKPDTKFNADGLYHTDHLVAGTEAEALAKKIDAAAQAALAESIQEMKPGVAKQWSLYVPYERLTDDETGEPTGEISFAYKQNAKIPSAKEPSGFKDIKIEIRDSSDEIVEVAVWDGSEGRVMFSMRPIVMAQSKQVGVRLDFAKVQITKLKRGSGGSKGFGAVEDGYVADQEEAGFGEAPQGGGAADDTGGDY